MLFLECYGVVFDCYRDDSGFWGALTGPGYRVQGFCSLVYDRASSGLGWTDLRFSDGSRF